MLKKFILPILFALILLILLVPACGGGDDDTVAPTSSPTATQTTVPTITPTPTTVPTATPTTTPTATPTATPTPVPTFTTTPTVSPTTTPSPITPSTTELPCRFHGSVQINGTNVPDGTLIVVTINGYVYTTTTPSAYGPSTYAIKIFSPQGVTFDAGTQITFMINNNPAQQTGSWQKGGNFVLNLTAQ